MPVLLSNRWVGRPAATYPPLIITTASLPSTTIGQAYSTSVSATGGKTPYTWSFLDIAPNTGWLSINSATGAITGTAPANPENDAVLVQVIDANGTKASAPYSISVGGNPLVIVTSSPLPSGTVGSFYSLGLVAQGGIPPYVWSLASATPNTGSWLSIAADGTVNGTPPVAEVESLVARVQDSIGTVVTKPFSLTVAVPASLSFPRVMLVAVAGDQSYGSNATNGYPNWLTAASGNAANTAVQTLGAYDAVILNGTFENWDTSGVRDRENLTQALLKNASYQVTKNTSRPTQTFYYCIMNATVAGNPNAQWQNLVSPNNWYLYESIGGTGTQTPAGGGQLFINYSAAWPTAIGSAGIGASICGRNYGTTSTGSPTGVQGPARTFGNYAAIKLLMRGVTVDTRFSFNQQMGSPNAAGIFLDECFVALNGEGTVPDSSLDGITIAPGSQQGGGFPGLDTVQPVMARGIHNMFDQMQTMLATYGTPGKTYYNFGNFGQYANKYQFGTATLTCGLENTMHGGLMESVLGSGTASWECFQIGNPNTGNTTYASGWPNLKDNYYQGMDFCLSPKMVGLGCKLPSKDGLQTASWPVGAGTTPTTVTSGTALEYQLMRYGLCTTLLDDGYFAPGVPNYDYSVVRWYDEYGDDSLVQVNVRRGYLGSPLTTRPTSPTWAQGTMGVWSRRFTNGIAIVNPRGNGAQTITLPQTYQALTGTQQPTINNGATLSSLTIPDGDGRIFILPTQTFAITSLITGINNGMVAFDDHGGNSITWMTDATGGFARVNTKPSTTVQGGTCGLQWTGLDTTKKGIYLKYDLRRTSLPNSKECKIFGFGYPPPGIFSDFTWGCNVGGYSGNTPGLSYSDASTGGDINTQFWLYAAPTLTGGSSYSRTPHPTINVQPASTFRYDIAGNWQTHEIWMLQNDDGTPNGEVAQWIDGTLVFWATGMWNCRTGGQGFVRVDLFGYTDPANPQIIEDYRNFYASYTRPTGRGI